MNNNLNLFSEFVKEMTEENQLLRSKVESLEKMNKNKTLEIEQLKGQIISYFYLQIKLDILISFTLKIS